MTSTARARPSEPSPIDGAAASLRADAPLFTPRNLYFEVRRALGPETTEARFDAMLRRRLSRARLPGLLRGGEPSRRKGGRDEVLRAVLLVDRPAMRQVLAAAPAIAQAGLAVIDAAGSPRATVDRLTRLVRDGLRVAVLYVHDAATVIYPFALEPLSSLVRQASAPVAYRDLGLPPLGATARRFGDPRLAPGESILELEAVPPGTLARYCASAAEWLAPSIQRSSRDP